MKKILKWIVIVVFVVAGWYLVSPLFLNKTVDEALPVSQEGDIPSQVSGSGAERTLSAELSSSDFVQDEQEPSVSKRGKFTGADRMHKGEGDLVVIRDNDKTFIRFENFNVTNGPDLFVTLNKGGSPKGEHVLLGRLKGNKGSQNYDISGYDIDDYASVSIYCRAFSVEFATARL